MFLQASIILSTGGLHLGDLHRGGGSASRQGLHPGGSASAGGVCLGGESASSGVGQTPHRILWDMVNKQAVCILLECILVY